MNYLNSNKLIEINHLISQGLTKKLKMFTFFLGHMVIKIMELAMSLLMKLS